MERRRSNCAKRACELTSWGDPGMIAVLAVGYAECGDFENAVKWQTDAIGKLKSGQEQERRRTEALSSTQALPLDIAIKQ